MGTLLLKLSAPLQAWGIESKFETRRAGKEPSKSGVIGLLAAALGRRRDESIQDLNNLRFGVRVDKEGELLRDYHTVKMSTGKTYVTQRYYLSDATFLVGLESEDDELLELLKKAVNNPVFPLYLGRRSCVPVPPVSLGIRPLNLVDALKNEPWQLSSWMQKKEQKKGNSVLRIIVDAEPSEKFPIAVKDLPVSFHQDKRQYTYRPVTEISTDIVKKTTLKETTHDVMADL